jgi:hypothetical protein
MLHEELTSTAMLPVHGIRSSQHKSILLTATTLPGVGTSYRFFELSLLFRYPPPFNIIII